MHALMKITRDAPHCRLPPSALVRTAEKIPLVANAPRVRYERHQWRRGVRISEHDHGAPVSSTDALQAKVQNASLISWCRYSQFVVLLEEDRCLVGGEWLN